MEDYTKDIENRVFIMIVKGQWDEVIALGEQAVEPFVQAFNDGKVPADALLKFLDSDTKVRIKTIEGISNFDSLGIESLYVLAKLGETRALEPLLTYALKGLEEVALIRQGGVTFRLSEMRSSLMGITRLKEALIDISHKSALSEEAIKLAIKAVTYYRKGKKEGWGKYILDHDRNSLSALQMLCSIKSPAISNILYRITLIEDRKYWVDTYVEARRVTLSFEEHREIARKELACRAFTTYDPSNYFAEEHQSKDAQLEVTGALLATEAPVIKVLIKTLQNANPSVQEEALDVLTIIGEPAIESLIQALRDGIQHLRERRIRIKDLEQGSQALKEGLRDDYWYVRTGVAMALVKIGEAAVEPLIMTLNDDEEYVRRKAADALGKIGDARAAEPLLQVLKIEDISDNERKTVERALEKLKAEDSQSDKR